MSEHVMPKRRSEISKASSDPDMGEFWDHHDLGRFWDLTRPADVTVDLDETLEDNDLWDGKIEEDAEAGRLDPLADKAIDAHRRGESRKL